jgi:CO dehydrogenase/acetyl-CoA synthase alpha subunit
MMTQIKKAVNTHVEEFRPRKHIIVICSVTAVQVGHYRDGSLPYGLKHTAWYPAALHSSQIGSTVLYLAVRF